MDGHMEPPCQHEPADNYNQRESIQPAIIGERNLAREEHPPVKGDAFHCGHDAGERRLQLPVC